MTLAHDPETLAFYDREASAYAAHQQAHRHPSLDDFLGQLSPGAKILELGCGGGQDAHAMLQAGFDVEPTDGSTLLAAQAERLLGRTVRVMRFDELDAHASFDGVWANACLIHVPQNALAGVLGRIWRALKVGGVFFASYKAGDGGARDALGRYNNFPSREDLDEVYRRSGPWSELAIHERPGGGYDGVARVWLGCWARKGQL
jgi:SAM-dependent methyltransferase